MPETVFSNANIVLADEVINGSVCVTDGEISDISQGNTTLPSAVDLEGDHLIPGLVELHTDNLERHIMPRPKSFWPTKAAVLNHDREVTSAGITTVFDAICVGHIEGGARSSDTLEDTANLISKMRADDKLLADHRIHWRCEVSGDQLMDRLDVLTDITGTGLVSVMDHTPGQRQFVSLEAYYTYYQGKFGLSDDEMKSYMDERIEAQKRNSIPNRKAVVELARVKQIPLASHDDASVEHVDEARNDGIVVAEFPTTDKAAAACREAGIAVMMGAPNVVRGKSHSGNVSARDLARQGNLEILSSDYVPYSLLHGAVLLEQECEAITLPEAIATVTRNPAANVGMADRGEIQIGKRADLVRFRVEEDVPSIKGVWARGARIA